MKKLAILLAIGGAVGFPSLRRQCSTAELPQLITNQISVLMSID